jgi:hypothetical protein
MEDNEVKFKDNTISVYIKNKTTLKDAKKNKLSLMANFVHFIDSQILTLTRTKLLEKKIKSLGIHDCIIVDHKYYDETINEYNNSLKELEKSDIFEILSLQYDDYNTFIKEKSSKELKYLHNKKKNKIDLKNPQYSLLPT